MIVIDNFLTDPKAVNAINYSKFWEDQSYYWNDFKWKQRYEGVDSGSNSIGAYIVERMMQDEGLLEAYPFYSITGFEYWPTVLMPGMDLESEEDGIYSLNIHTDFDLVRFKTKGEIRHPSFGCVMYFGNEDVEGGELRVWETNECTYESVSPKHNRLVVFDSHKPHGVTEVTKGIRKSIAINFWREPIMLPEEGELT